MSTECWTCHHPAADHPVDEPGDPMSLAPCTACDCRDYDGMDHPDRPSLADTLIFRTEDGGIGWVADPEERP
jgi:hypothetical protein